MKPQEKLSPRGQHVLAACLSLPLTVMGGAYAMHQYDLRSLENNPRGLSEYTSETHKDLSALCHATGAELNAQFRRAGIADTITVTTDDQRTDEDKPFCKLELRKDFNTTFYDPAYILTPESGKKIIDHIARGLDDASLLRLRAALDKNPGHAP